MSGVKRWLDQMMNEVSDLQEQGLSEDAAIKQVADKYDVSGEDLAYYILGALVV